MLLHAREMQRMEQAQARTIEAVAVGYAGCRSEKGGSAMQRILRALRGA